MYVAHFMKCLNGTPILQLNNNLKHSRQFCSLTWHSGKRPDVMVTWITQIHLEADQLFFWLQNVSEMAELALLNLIETWIALERRLLLLWLILYC